MKFLHTTAIAAAIATVQPRRVAVAYLGQDWPSYLTDLDSLEAIVVSPTIGTSPHAVARLVEALKRPGESGWDRLHFLDALHAKLYLGDAAMVVGSANLTANGLAGNRLLEAAVMTRDDTARAEAGAFFDEVMRQAAGAYPTVESKRRRLKQLFKEQSQAAGMNLTEGGTDGRFRSILELADPLPHFHVCWYTAEGPALQEDADQQVGFHIGDSVQMHPDDKIEAGQWVLTWRLSNAEQMDRRSKPCWMYVDHVQDDIVDLSGEDEAYAYTKAALQRTRSPAAWRALLATAPFHIDAPFIEAMARVLQEHDILREALVQPGTDYNTNPWRLAKATAKVPLFVEVMQQALRR